MAMRSKDASGSAADHQQDLYSWLVEQARLVRDGRWQAVDQDNLAREIEGLAQHKLRSERQRSQGEVEAATVGMLSGVADLDLEVVTILVRNDGIDAQQMLTVFGHVTRPVQMSSAETARELIVFVASRASPFARSVQ